MVFPDGRKYTGEFKEELMDGEGTMTFPDGRKQSGKFEKGEFLGGEA